MASWGTTARAALVVAGGAVTWGLALEVGWSGGDGSFFGHAPAETRGDTVNIDGHHVETPEEREKRLDSSHSQVREEIGNAKRALLGDRRRTRGDDVRAPVTHIPRAYDYTVREACEHLKLEEPEKFEDVDCMSADYDNPDPYWTTGH